MGASQGVGEFAVPGPGFEAADTFDDDGYDDVALVRASAPTTTLVVLRGSAAGLPPDRCAPLVP